MSGQSIGAIGAYPGLSAADYQALAAVMNTPNPNASVSFRGTQGTGATTQDSQTTSQPAVQYVQVPEKKNNKALVVLGVIAAVGAGACILGAVKGNPNKKGLEKISDGLSTVWKNITGKSGEATTKAAESAKDAVTKGKRTITEVVDKAGNTTTVVTLPEEKNIISAVKGKKYNTWRGLDKANDALKNIGEEQITRGNKLSSRMVNEGTLKKGNELRSFVIEETRGGKTFRAISADGGKKFTLEQVLTDRSGKKTYKVMDFSDNKKLYTSLEEKAQKVWAGKGKLEDLKQVIIRSTDKNTGLVSTIKAEKGNETFLSAVTNKFSINSQKVRALCADPKSSIRKSIESYKKDGGKSLNLLRGDVKMGSNILTFDNSGNLLSVKQPSGRILDSTRNKDAFLAFQYDNETAIAKTAKTDKSKWFNRVFEI